MKQLSNVMVNRRLLRVKILEKLYAYRINRRVEKDLLRKNIKEYFRLELLKIGKEKSSLINGRQEKAIEIFEEWEARKDLEVNWEEVHADDKVYLEKEISNYRKYLQNFKSTSRKNLIDEVELLFEVSSSLLKAIINLRRKAIEAFEDKGYLKKYASNKEVLYQFFQESYFLQSLEKEIELKKLVSNKIADKSFDIEDWYYDLVKSEEFKAVSSKANGKEQKDNTLLDSLINDFLFKEDKWLSSLEDYFLFGEEDKRVLKKVFKKRLLNASQEQLETSFDWEDSKKFVLNLFDYTTKQEKELWKEIEKKLKKWEGDRVAKMDKIILLMGLSEMLYFPSIPIKSTLNEYVEISKRYSTSKSHIFVNGILDSLSKELVSSGRIKKSGRGLIDNN